MPRGGLNLQGEIEAAIEPVDQLATVRQAVPLLGLCQRRIYGRRDVDGDRTDGFGHDQGEEARPEVEFLVKQHVLGAVREGKQADMLGLPARECLEGSLDQPLGNAPSPEVRVNRERPEEPDAAPIDREVGPD
jgi:hypothetical protein